MPTYQCDLCNYKTKIKTHFNRHINTPKHQKNYLSSNSQETQSESKKRKPRKAHKEKQLKESDGEIKIVKYSGDHKIDKIDNTEVKIIETKKLDFECDMCGRKLSSKGHLTRHIQNYCPASKSKKENTILKDLLEVQKQQFENERANLYKQIEKLLDKVGNTTNIQSNIKNTINLNSYGSENMSHITDQLKTNLVKIPYVMIPKLIEAVHFNDEHPENKNIALTNSRDNKIKVFSDNRWVYKDKEETINDLVDGKYYILDTHYDNINDTLENDCKTNFVKFKEYFNSEDKEFVNKLKKECELVLLNNR